MTQHQREAIDEVFCDYLKALCRRFVEEYTGMTATAGCEDENYKETFKRSVAELNAAKVALLETLEIK